MLCPNSPLIRFDMYRVYMRWRLTQIYLGTTQQVDTWISEEQRCACEKEILKLYPLLTFCFHDEMEKSPHHSHI